MGRFAKPFGTHSGLGTGSLAQRYTPTNLVSKAAEDARHCRANVQQVANKCSRINVEEWQSG